MKFHARNITLLVATLSILVFVGFTTQAADSTDIKDISTLLDKYNRAASNADYDAYFATLDPNGVFIGTDAKERWTIDELRAFVKPYFDQGQSRLHTPQDRHIDLCPGGNVAYFDELVELESLGECRGTGVVIKVDDKWLITQYSLSFPVPNEIVFDVVDRIQNYHEKQENPPADIEASIRKSLNSYLATASYPQPGPIDPELFATDIEAQWSNGKTYRSRKSVVNALKEGQRDMENSFESFEAKAQQVRMHRKGDMAWVMCNLKMKGTLKEDGKPFAKTIRSTFIFEKIGDSWQMSHEHSSRVEENQQR